MIGIELLARILPTILIIFILENIIKLDKYEKVYILASFLLISNLAIYFMLAFLGYNIYFSPLFAVKFASLLLVINAIVMYLFLVIKDKLLKKFPRNKKRKK